MKKLPVFPAEVRQYVRKVFAGANRRLGEKIARVPNCPEPSLDMTLIEHLSQHAGPYVVAPGWAVRIDVHFLGGLRHFYRWEIADIGLLVFAKRSGSLLAQKIALLQSKRLYPNQHGVIEETLEDYYIGFGRLLPDWSKEPALSRPHTFSFSEKSAYKALQVRDDQYGAIESYESEGQIPVHYLMYNPWTVPTSYHSPVTASPTLGPKANGGARVMPAAKLRAALAGKPDGYSPTFADVRTCISSATTHAYGWRLEHFVADQLLGCRQGRLFEDVNEEDIFRLFNRRSGPIAAAVAITVEQFDADLG